MWDPSLGSARSSQPAANCDPSSPPGVSLTMHSPPDAAIVARVIEGDVNAFAFLVTRYRDRGARYATRMLGRVEDAEEALQDAFVRAYRALEQCDDPEHFDRWFFSILANRCRTHGARIGARERLFVMMDDDVGSSETTSAIATPYTRPEDDAAWREEIDNALAQLDGDQREAFLLKHVEDMSYEQMAEVTGVGISALKMRVKRACERLRVMLHEAYANG